MPSEHFVSEYDFPDGSESNQQSISEVLFIQEELYGKTLDISDGSSGHADGGSDDIGCSGCGS